MYTISYLLPFTRTKWKFIGLFVFLLLAWWVGSWSWYTVTGKHTHRQNFINVYSPRAYMWPIRLALAAGLTLAELAVAYDLAELSKHAIPIPMPKRLLKSGRMHIPSWAPPALLLALGTTFKYLWEDKFPQDRDDNIVWHANQSTGGFNTGFNLSEQHYPRLDDWFFAAGAMFLIEMSSKVRRVLDNPVFRQLGRLSFRTCAVSIPAHDRPTSCVLTFFLLPLVRTALYLLSGIIFLSLGTLIHNHLVHSQGWTNEANVLAAVFFAVVPVALVSAEIFQRIVEEPSFISARFGFNWLRAE